MEQTDGCQRGGVGGRKRPTQELTCICAFPTDSDNRAARAWVRAGARGGGTGGERRETSVILSTIRIFKKKGNDFLRRCSWRMTR